MGTSTTVGSDEYRFEFGENWSQFLPLVDERRIRDAEVSLSSMLECSTLEGRRFLDVGCGSGLFSLAARRLGARVVSFDYDPNSVACTLELKRRYFPDDLSWSIQQGSALDETLLDRLGAFDVVYSWGVLHHTGNMWQALANMDRCVKPGGQLFIAIYNDTGTQAQRWRFIKRTYNRLPRPLRKPFAALVVAPIFAKSLVRASLTFSLGKEIRSWFGSNLSRGMTRWRDIVDWVGGYPYEFATADVIFDFYRKRGYRLQRLIIGGGLGCNEFVFVKER